jgi:hypothetical protein
MHIKEWHTNRYDRLMHGVRVRVKASYSKLVVGTCIHLVDWFLSQVASVFLDPTNTIDQHLTRVLKTDIVLAWRMACSNCCIPYLCVHQSDFELHTH